MKFTNVKQLIIKFMGGGLINFPTRFLRWVKINGDTDNSDDGDGGGGGEDNEYLSNVLELLYTPGIIYNFLTTDNIYTDGCILTKGEYQDIIVESPGNTIGDYDTANYILKCFDSNEFEYTYICLTEEELNLLKEVVKTPQTITMKEYLETMIEFQYPNGYIYNNNEYPVYIPDLVDNGDEYVSTNDIPIFVLNEVNFEFAYSTAPFNGERKVAVIRGFNNDLRSDFGYINRVLIRCSKFEFVENNGVFIPVPGIG